MRRVREAVMVAGVLLVVGLCYHAGDIYSERHLHRLQQNVKKKLGKVDRMHQQQQQQQQQQPQQPVHVTTIPPALLDRIAQQGDKKKTGWQEGTLQHARNVAPAAVRYRVNAESTTAVTTSSSEESKQRAANQAAARHDASSARTTRTNQAAAGHDALSTTAGTNQAAAKHDASSTTTASANQESSNDYSTDQNSPDEQQPSQVYNQVKKSIQNYVESIRGRMGQLGQRLSQGIGQTEQPRHLHLEKDRAAGGGQAAGGAGLDLILTAGEQADPDLRHTLQEYKQRRVQLAKACRSVLPEHDALAKLVRKHLHVDERHKAVYCLIPKAGSTNWLRMLFNMSTGGERPDVVRGHVHGLGARHRQGLTTLEEYSDEDRQLILKNFAKVIIVRNPFTRWLSGYKQKFKLKSYQKHAGRDIIKKYRPDASRKSRKKGDDVRFSEFLKYLIDKGKESDHLNQHWASYTSLCDPCNVEYDYVAKVETIDKDVEALRQIIFDQSPQALMPKAYTNATQTRQIRSYYADISAEDINQLTTLFADDFAMFGYGLTLDNIT